MARAKAKRDTDKEKASRQAAQDYFKANPDKKSNDVIAHLKGKGLWVPADGKNQNVWGNNQRKTALGTTATVRRPKPNHINEAQLGRDISDLLGGPEKAIKALEAVKKLGTVSIAIKAVERWDAVLKASPDAKAATKILDALK